MIVKKITEAVIYETMDGDETIYVRQPGTDALSESPRAQDLHAQIKEDQLWGQIRRAAKTNHTLQRALEEAILIYNLSK
jgi:hypothetical protein